MKSRLTLQRIIWVATICLAGLALLASALFYTLSQQRQSVGQQDIAARAISRYATRMLVQTHAVSMYPNEMNTQQWWSIHQSISDEMDQLDSAGEPGTLTAQLESRLIDLADLFTGYSGSVSVNESALEKRRSDLLIDRLISEAEQLAEISYKAADSASLLREELTEKRRRILIGLIITFAVNALVLLLLMRYRVIRPLVHIEQVAGEMQQGNLAARCHLRPGDELGDVGAALESLACELDSRLTELNSTSHLLEVAGRMCGVGAWTLNFETGQLYWSKQIYAIVEADFTRQPSLEEAIGLYLEDSATRLAAAIDDASQTGQNLNIELQLRTYKGNVIWVHVFGEVAFEVNHNMRKASTIRGAFLDITERRRVESEIRQAKEIAESASKAKGDFLSNISHEIRTPLNAVVGLAYILKQSKLDALQFEYVEKLENAGRGLVELVSGVLDVSKIEAGAMELERRPFSARGLLDSLADLMTGPVADKNLEFVVSVDPNVPDHLVGDEIKLRQVLVNLAGNAIKVTENGFVKVGLTLDQLESRNCVLRFVVQDTGLGMDASAMKRLFQSFSQADASISRRFGGTGIGLALSQKLVELMGGTISAVSAPGQGSLFAFSLVLDLDAAAAKEAVEIAPNLEVVLVDSFKPQLDAMLQIMDWLGVKAHGFTSARLALDFTLNSELNLFVVNHHLTDMSGAEFARLVKKRQGKKAARVALMVKPKELESMQHAGVDNLFDTLVIKPISTSRMKAMVLELGSGQEATLSLRAEMLRRQDLLLLEGLRVLAVDDHKLNLMILRKILEAHGATVVLAEAAQTAIDILSKPNHSDIDVCLMDVQMPSMDGLEACEYIRAQLGLRDLPILALTAGAMQADHQKALDSGMNEVLTKPLQVDKVLDAVSRWGAHKNEMMFPGLEEKNS